ncbi:MAG: malto-oligosyltrehalose trehalohydrolase [Isosphaeraceae bacterium]|nr:malto-oligosyltrehalose trehalohydrolase [Isosphaeraceae bacterium]
MPRTDHGRRLPVGAEVSPEGGISFRVWAPRCRRVEVAIYGKSAHAPEASARIEALTPEGDGYFSETIASAGPGILYRYRLDGGEAFPDPASRYQPEGPHGPSQVIDPSTFAWTDHEWHGLRIEGQVLYELHVGTFTSEGTWEAAAEELPELRALGITGIELLPVAEFPGRFGWGYDGVDLFAPYHCYGTPDDFRRFVDEAHRLGLGVLLDVVYNHFGPEGSYLDRFSDDFYSKTDKTEWGDAINFDGPNSGPVREFFLANAGYWIEEFHLDGLRIDATQQFFDNSDEHIISQIVRRARAAAQGREVILIGENESQQVMLMQPEEQGGYGLDALWNEDFHHVAVLAATGRREGYYSDYRGSPQEFVSAFKGGFLYQGQRNIRQRKRRGSLTRGVFLGKFVNYLQNHDQVANTFRGERLHDVMSPSLFRVMTAVLLLAPGTPMLFQGQEYAASTPFHYFSDLAAELREPTRQARFAFLSQFPSQALPESRTLIPDPFDPATFACSKLDPSERTRNLQALFLHRDLIRLRREDPVLRRQGADGLDGAVLAPEAFVIRYFSGSGEDRLLVVNLGADLHLAPITEPLLAPPEDREWRLLWSSEDVRYGGSGTPPPVDDRGWWLPGHSALVLALAPMDDRGSSSGA